MKDLFSFLKSLFTKQSYCQRSARPFYLALFTITIFISTAYKTNAQLHLIPNEGQWKGDFLYKGSLRSGQMYVQKNGIVYNLVDFKALEPYHRNLPVKKTSISAHAVHLEWLNANKDATV